MAHQEAAMLDDHVGLGLALMRGAGDGGCDLLMRVHVHNNAILLQLFLHENDLLSALHSHKTQAVAAHVQQ